MAIISLITDFGTQDEYVGLLKAVILGIDPAAVTVDVSHAVDPQDVAQAAFLVQSAYAYFPGRHSPRGGRPGGGQRARHPVARSGGTSLRRPGQRRTVPGDGRRSAVSAAAAGKPGLARAAVSPTFHGRDVMAPAAAQLSRGADTTAFGPAMDPGCAFASTGYSPSHPNGEVCGRIIHIDRFGNLITNIDAAALRSRGSSWEIGVGSERIRGFPEPTPMRKPVRCWH